ncbi:hypothetical protein RND71_026211 [Anisodus tanguticus]|uniref:Uncharacterized protein n=1 Tax=Anisodus tanguticus TaxID=243964 RepID=A0AAE1RNH4_9SOLA|nr:hypothetical protein RND71_026211 [Anisodus tanguticus]
MLGFPVSCSTSTVNFDDTRKQRAKERSFFPSFDKEENSNEEYDVSFHQPEKKRRLSPNQVYLLGKSFEIECFAKSGSLGYERWYLPDLDIVWLTDELK